MIEYRDVWKAFDQPVLSVVAISLRTGETISLVGPSGTGKSVLLKTTLGLIIPDRGDVLIDGDSVVNASRDTLHRIRRKVGYVFQYAALFDSMNTYENVCQGLRDDDMRAMGDHEVLRRVCESLEDVNLDPEYVLPKLPSQLSGGMRKRVGLARALVGRPQVILYDEPVTGLDPVNSATVDQLIVQIALKTKVTSIVVTHDIVGALEISDRVALLDHGKLRFVGTPDEFKVSPDPLVRAFADRTAAAEAALKIMEDK
jgi:phospholipid/cholesterol/gamma-HCH transport system ATP-binding protein